MAVNPHVPLLTVRQYLEIERNSPFKHEYVDGHVYAMAGGTRRHGAISANIIAALTSRLGGRPCQVYTSDVKAQLSPTRYVYPDSSVSCDERDRMSDEDEEEDRIRYPRLAVEVLSRSTEAYDRNEKFALYRGSETLQDYVLVETGRMAVEVHHCDEEGSWICQEFGSGDDIVLNSLAIRLPIADVYKGVNL